MSKYPFKQPDLALNSDLEQQYYDVASRLSEGTEIDILGIRGVIDFIDDAGFVFVDLDDGSNVRISPHNVSKIKIVDLDYKIQDIVDTVNYFFISNDRIDCDVEIPLCVDGKNINALIVYMNNDTVFCGFAEFSLAEAYENEHFANDSITYSFFSEYGECTKDVLINMVDTVKEYYKVQEQIQDEPDICDD